MIEKGSFKSKQYFPEIDILKGLGIFLVVFGHLSFSNKNISHLIFSFHMPLFYILSGFVFSRKKTSIFIASKFRRILIPYVFFSLISFLAYYILNYRSSIFNIAYFFIGTFYGISNDFYLAWNVVLWFLPSIFLINILFNILYKEKLWFLLLILWFLGFILMYNIEMVLPFHIKSTLLAIPFFGFGILLRTKYLFLENFFNKFLEIKALFLLLIGIVLAIYNRNTPDLRLAEIGQPFVFYSAAIFIALALFGLGKRLKGSSLIWLGVNSLVIMGLHLKFRFLGEKLIKFFPFETESFIYNLFVSITILFLLLIPIKLLNRYLPVLVGRK